MLHPPNRLVFQLAVQGVLLLHVLRGRGQSKGRISFLADIKAPRVFPRSWSWEEPQDHVIDMEGWELLTSRSKSEQVHWDSLTALPQRCAWHMDCTETAIQAVCQSSVFSVCMYDASGSVLGRWAEVFSNHSHDMLWTKSGSKQFLSSTVSLTPRSAGAYHSWGRRGTRVESTVTRSLAYYQLLL